MGKEKHTNITLIFDQNSDFKMKKKKNVCNNQNDDHVYELIFFLEFTAFSEKWSFSILCISIKWFKSFRFSNEKKISWFKLFHSFFHIPSMWGVWVFNSNNK